MFGGHHHGHRQREWALEREERREEGRAFNDLLHGNVGGFLAHESRAGQLRQAERREEYLDRAERREERAAAWDMRHGNVFGAAAHMQNARNLECAEQANMWGAVSGVPAYAAAPVVPLYGTAGAVEASLYRAERQEERRAEWDLMTGNIGGAIRHEQNARNLQSAEFAVAQAALAPPVVPAYTPPVPYPGPQFVGAPLAAPTVVAAASAAPVYATPSAPAAAAIAPVPAYATPTAPAAAPAYATPVSATPAMPATGYYVAPSMPATGYQPYQDDSCARCTNGCSVM